MIDTLLVIAKEPVPGRVKTRLVPPFTYEQAAQLAAAALRDTLRTAAEVDAKHRVLVFDGSPEGWLPEGWTTVPQACGGLDLRLAAAFAGLEGPAVLIGMDTPQFAATSLVDFADGYDACLGLAQDGGFWAIGFADPSVAARSITGVVMSTARTGADQLTRLTPMDVLMLDPLLDVDDAASASRVAALAPAGEFARCFRALTGGRHVG